VRKLLVTPFAHGLHVEFVEFRFLIHFLVTQRARETVDAPAFVQSLEHITGDHMTTLEAHVAEQLMKVRFTVGKTLAFKVTRAQERLLTFGADKVLHMPMFAQRRHHALLDRPTTRTTYRYAHLVVTP